jgi:hypothetical protein
MRLPPTAPGTSLRVRAPASCDRVRAAPCRWPRSGAFGVAFPYPPDSATFAAGPDLLKESVEPSTVGGSAPNSFPFLFLGEAELLARRGVEAAQTSRRALEQARGRRERGWEAWTIRLLGDIAAHRGSPDIAEVANLYQGSLALATELGMRPLVAHCHLGLGKLSRRTGDRQQAQEHLTAATTMYREMDMRFWLEQAGAAMRELA